MLLVQRPTALPAELDLRTDREDLLGFVDQVTLAAADGRLDTGYTLSSVGIQLPPDPQEAASDNSSKSYTYEVHRLVLVGTDGANTTSGGALFHGDASFTFNGETSIGLSVEGLLLSAQQNTAAGNASQNDAVLQVNGLCASLVA
jgi:hypothetical protein